MKIYFGKNNDKAYPRKIATTTGSDTVKSRKTRMKFVICATCILGLALVLIAFVIKQKQTNSDMGFENVFVDESCSFEMVESIPIGLKFPANATYLTPLDKGFTKLLHLAQSRLDVASFYWTMAGRDIGINDSSAHLGEEMFRLLLSLPSKSLVFRAISSDAMKTTFSDLANMTAAGVQVRVLHMHQLTGGVMHSKLWVVDQQHIFIGSPNMDWRAFTQVKELGIIIYNCSCLARDLQKVFDSYWEIGKENSSIPRPWPSQFNTNINKSHPLHLKMNGIPTELYIASSPTQLNGHGRTPDLSSILSIIGNAQSFVNIALMKYLPSSEFRHHRRFWPLIDDALRRAAYEHRVHVKLLVGCWRKTHDNLFVFLQSLLALADNSTGCNIQVKLFKLPVDESQKGISATRIYHHKFMVTDKAAYIGTSNWSEDYFVSTAGVGLVVNQTEEAAKGLGLTVQEKLVAVFNRDWGSQYARTLGNKSSMRDWCHDL
uniref:5'-3' exonuclease PLD3-like n=1 Tax=Myxine glutinosa TaxID=7769 RepID=UPI00358F1CD5